ncbi:hypothetical protein NX722_11215 [Endozoicomonas gorgoniicola]|uniref:Uncharacterized protein n=1 Tax=Endozoicomonas gorgoniicola TaxID=1234144 RepID=A0ABT3MV00_9GAMM|nr:hypothetical protein [Endozoicomonas gorgoniicola]MCW7553197.1 hypothetical protein [Endozoicomonas gorgoniicola]
MNLQNPKTLAELTQCFSRLLEIAPCLEGINNEEEYQQALANTEALLIAIGDNPDDPRNHLLNMMTHQVDAYEYRMHPILSQWDQGDGVTALLKILMRQHSLKQSDLPEIGSRVWFQKSSTVSAP